MAITTYAELQTSVADYLARSDLTLSVPTFIRLCEVHAQRQLRVRKMEKRSVASTQDGGGDPSAYLAVPSDFLEARSFTLQTDPKIVMAYQAPNMLDTNYTTGSGRPEAFTIIGDNFKFGPTPDAVYTVELIYYAAIDPLTSTNTTNWLLTGYPDIYLYGALCEAAPYIKDDARIAVWMGLYDRAISEIKGEDARARWGGSALSARVDITVG